MTALPDWDIASDADLAGAAAAGDRAAFAGIYDRYADRLHDFCIGMLRDRWGWRSRAAGRLSEVRRGRRGVAPRGPVRRRR